MEALDRSVKDFEPHLALCGGEDGSASVSVSTRGISTAGVTSKVRP